MKKFTWIAASLLLFVAVGCSQQAPQVKQDEAPAKTSNGGDYAGIVYINSDSLIHGYQMFKDLSAEFGAKAEKVQNELNKRMVSFEAKVKTFENKVNKGLITRYDAQQSGEQLEEERRILLEYRDKQMADLQEQESVMTNNISESVRVYIEEYNKVKKYKMIINTSAATSVVVAGDPSIDITADVLVGLNKGYVPVVK